MKLILFLFVCHILHSAIRAERGSSQQVMNLVNGKFDINEQRLSAILNKVNTSTEVAVLSIAGAYRQGKSFLLNFFLQYLDFLQETKSNGLQKGSWLKDIDRQSGFSFKSGIDPETIGMNMWSEPFIIKTKDDKEIAVLLIDTQGLYDQETTNNDNVRLFTMDSMLSSTLMFNTKTQLGFDKLKELKSFLEYASSFASFKNAYLKPFQRLTFVIRDFDLLDSYEWSAGNEMLSRYTNKSFTQSSDVKLAVSQLYDGFGKIDAFAFCHPGFAVTKDDYDGSLSKLQPMFLEQVKTFVEDIIDNIEPRRPMYYNITAGEFLNHTISLAEAFNSGLSPADMAEAQERNEMVRVMNEITRLVNGYIASISESIDTQPNEHFLKETDAIADEIQKFQAQALQNIISAFSESKTAKVIIGTDDDGKPKSVLQELQGQLDNRFNSSLDDFMQKAQNKQENASRLTNDTINKLLTEHENYMKNFINRKPDWEFCDGNTELKYAINQQHYQNTQHLVQSFRNDPVSRFAVQINGKWNTTAFDVLCDRLHSSNILQYLKTALAKRANATVEVLTEIKELVEQHNLDLDTTITNLKDEYFCQTKDKIENEITRMHESKSNILLNHEFKCNWLSNCYASSSASESVEKNKMSTAKDCLKKRIDESFDGNFYLLFWEALEKKHAASGETAATRIVFDVFTFGLYEVIRKLNSCIA